MTNERSAWRPARRITISEWADSHRVLDQRFAAEPGQWRTDRTPYVREWMNAARSKNCRRITILASTQVGKTEALNNIAGFFMHQEPSPIMLVMPNREAAQVAAEKRIVPMIMATPALRGELTEERHDVKKREITLRRSVFYFRSANSATDLASVPVRLVLGDECDKWPRWAGREASPLDLVTERTRTFFNHVVVLASTPTTRDGLIWREFERGDERRYWMPCPRCGKHQTFVFKQVKWDDDATWYECLLCQVKLDDRDKRWMTQRGTWVPREVCAADNLDEAAITEWKTITDDRTEHRSYHIWAAYSPWITWESIRTKFEDARHDPESMMNFTNSWLGELWEERVETTTDAIVDACITTRKQFDVPKEVLVLTASVDVQKDYMVWALQGWGNDEETWVIAADRANTWDEVGDVLFRNTYGENNLRVQCCLVDSRYRRDEVMDFCRKWHPSARMIAGVERDSPLPFSTVKLDKHPRTGQALKHTMIVWTVNVDWFKDVVAQRLRNTSESETNAGAIHLPADLSIDLLRQISSEQKIVDRRTTKVRRRWVLRPGYQRNEMWDLLVYNAAAARIIHCDKLRSDAQMRTHAARPKRRERRAIAPSIGRR